MQTSQVTISLAASLSLLVSSCATSSEFNGDAPDTLAIVVAGPGEACATETSSGLFCMTGLVCAEGRCVDDPDRCAPGEHVAWQPRANLPEGVVLRGAPPRVLCISDADPQIRCDACETDEQAVSACLPPGPFHGRGPVRCVPKRADEADAHPADRSHP
jgi:hypothetical protein